MSAPTPRRPPEAGDPPAPFVSTPNAERYLLEADNLRRRQLRSALLHGSSRTWRDRRRTWPAVLGGVIVVAVICAAIAIHGAFQMQRQERAEQERERQEQQRQLDLERQEQQRGPEQPPQAPDAQAITGVDTGPPGAVGLRGTDGWPA